MGLRGEKTHSNESKRKVEREQLAPPGCGSLVPRPADVGVELDHDKDEQTDEGLLEADATHICEAIIRNQHDTAY